MKRLITVGFLTLSNLLMSNAMADCTSPRDNNFSFGGNTICGTAANGDRWQEAHVGDDDAGDVFDFKRGTDANATFNENMKTFSAGIDLRKQVGTYAKLNGKGSNPSNRIIEYTYFGNPSAVPPIPDSVFFFSVRPNTDGTISFCRAGTEFAVATIIIANTNIACP